MKIELPKLDESVRRFIAFGCSIPVSRDDLDLLIYGNANRVDPTFPKEISAKQPRRDDD